MSGQQAGEAQQDPGAASDAHAFAGVTGNSISVATWTAVSRLTGFVRVAVIAAVLGPTFFGNLFQATNLLPNITYEFLTGALFASLLVPALVRHVDVGDRAATARLAGGFLGVATLGFLLVAAVTVLLGPLVLSLLTLGVEDPAVRAAQQQVGWPLLAMLMPQVLFYGLAGTGAAVQNAHGRFALAAGAPALENLGVVATLACYAFLFGTGTPVGEVTVAGLLVLGLGTTAAVGLHAAAQWWGAWRLGIVLVPRAGWRDPEVRRVVRLVLPSLGYAGLSAVRLLGILVVAGRVPGGVVAFQVAMNFYHLPVALGARPIAAALLPRLARLHQEGRALLFREEWVRGVALSLFVTVPSATAYLVLAGPLARAVSFGEMAGPAGAGLVAVALATLAAGTVGEANLVIGTHAAYARLDATSPLRAMALRTSVTAAVATTALLGATGPAVLLVLGLGVSAGDLGATAYLDARLRGGLPAGEGSLLAPFGRAAAASALMIGPALLLAQRLPAAVGGGTGAALGVLAAAAVGLALFVAVQRLWRSPELAALVTGFRHREGARDR